MKTVGWYGRSRAAARRERGASAVEFAILAPMFFMLVFGGITAGLSYAQKNQIIHAAREAARYGATLATTQSFGGCSPQPTCWATSVHDKAIQAAAGNLDASVPQRRVCVALVQGPGDGVDGSGTEPTVYSTGGNYYKTDTSGTAASAPCFDDGGADTSLRVQVLVQREGYIEAVLWRSKPAMKSKATAKHESLPST